MKTQVSNPAMLKKFLERLRVYIDKNRPQPTKPDFQYPEDVHFSVAEAPYDENEVTDMERFLSQASRDTAMYNSPALQNTYHSWEKKTAVSRTFSSEVLRRLQENGMRPAEFYKAAELDKRVYSSMKRDYCYSPSRTTAIKCCLALRLSFQDAEQLLKLAGYSLSPGLSKDLAIRFCLENGIYNIANVNYLLDALGETMLA